MSFRLIAGIATLMVAVDAGVFATGAGTLPVQNGRPVVATVNQDAISLDELVAQLPAPIDRTRLQQGLGTSEEIDLLDRLVTIKLLFHEAVAMGIADLPEIRKQVDVTSREILREVLLQRLTKDIKPDPAAVEKRFRELSIEWKTSSLLFQDEAAAKRAKAELDRGAAFTDVAAKAVAAKTAKSDTDEAYHAKSDYLPQIAAAVAPLKSGQTSPVIRLQAGFVIVKVQDIRHPENAQARAAAKQAVLDQQRLSALKAHDKALRAQYAVVHAAVMKSVDYEAAKPGIDALLKDKRVLVDLKGGTPITVADLTDYLRMQFFHGDDKVRQGKQMNAKKADALDAMVGRRLLNLEAARVGIDRSTEYRDRVNGYTESLVFDTFVQKVIVPTSKMRQEEVKQYYDTHKKEYSNPPMIKARSLAFTRRPAAESAVRKLREGTDFRWLATNAEGQVGAEATDVLRLDGKPLIIDTLPPDVARALAGGRAGEVRLYEAPDGRVYVFAIDQIIQPEARPFDDVREEIARKLYNDKLKKNVTDYAGKLRAQAKVVTYLRKV